MKITSALLLSFALAATPFATGAATLKSASPVKADTCKAQNAFWDAQGYILFDCKEGSSEVTLIGKKDHKLYHGYSVTVHHGRTHGEVSPLPK